MKEGFHRRLKCLIDDYIFLGYSISKKFPHSEQYGMTSQARRALLSIMLNYIEGYARTKKKVMINFYEISYGSLQETVYIFYLAKRLKYITKKEYLSLFERKEEIAKMLWRTISRMKKEID